MSLNQTQIITRHGLLASATVSRPVETENLLLAALQRNEYESLRPHLISVEVASNATLYEAGDSIEWLYFPETAVVSLFLAQSDGALLEVAMTGREGVVGISSILEPTTALYCAGVTVHGRVLKIEVNRLRKLLRESDALRQKLFKYCISLLAQVSYRSACNCRHLLRGRLCTWLLMIHDRAQTEQIRLTHDFIADHLGIRRPGISEAANELRQNGVISYRRGSIIIINRAALEERACECYAALRL